MKFLKLKSILFTLIAIVTLFLVSCEEDYPKLPDNLSSFNLKEAPFKKEIVTKNDDGIFTFKLSSNNEEITNAFNENSLSFTFLNEFELNTILENEKLSNETEVENQEENLNIEDFNVKKSDFIGISLVKIVTNSTINEIPPYELNLSEAVLDVIRKTNAVTVFDFDSDVEINESTDKKKATTLWSNNKRVVIKGDCGTKFTSSKNYYSFYGSSYAEWLHFSTFKCRAYITPCGKGSNSSSGAESTWIRKVEIIIDVAPSIYGYSNSCWGDTHNLNLRNNSCNGYKPSGC